MSISHPSPLVGPNVEVAAGLRELAAFLDAHPELPGAWFAVVSLRAVRDDRMARETLALLAGALGERAIEQQVFGGDVEIRGEFGPVKLKASASVAELENRPLVEPAYQPIIPREFSVRVAA